MWMLLGADVGPQWLWLNVGILLMGGILGLNHVSFRPRTGLALTVLAIFLVVCWIVVADELKA
jgi:hypothetical protein